MLLAALALGPAPAVAQGPPEPQDPAVLLVMDASKSMAKDAGGGTTRIEAAREALRKVVEALPDDAEVGLRVYGSRASDTTRAIGCRDTRLAVPVGPLDREALVGAVEALEPTGFTPIGRSLRATPGDFGNTDRRRTVVLVSDGGDNCAPPDPCRVARDVARQGVELAVQVIGLQVSGRAREQLRCIARAGGGTYVDAGDPEELLEELRAAFARARRTYDATGTFVEGGPVAGQASPVGEGQYVTRVAPGEERWYALRLERGERLFVAATPLPGGEQSGGAFEIAAVAGDGEETIERESGLLDGDDLVDTEAVRAGPAGDPGDREVAEPGIYYFRLSLDEDFDPPPVPVELLVQTLGPSERLGVKLEPGPRLTSLPRGEQRPGPRRDGGEEDDDGASAGAALAAAGGGVLLGAIGGWIVAGRRRRRE
jgi:Ca-activated chloride channel family protein